jgi:hypothetical protein
MHISAEEEHAKQLVTEQVLPLQFEVPSDKVTFVEPSGHYNTHNPLFLIYPVEHSEQLLPF